MGLVLCLRSQQTVHADHGTPMQLVCSSKLSFAQEF